uniref:Uncharacterized protein n=1 Tax=Romanomermis culicivorax TaxID=13658 RepID=A0A915HMS7_ROMCU
LENIHELERQVNSSGKTEENNLQNIIQVQPGDTALQPIFPQAGTILGTHQMMTNSGLHQQQRSAHNHTASNGVTMLQNDIVPNINNVI